MFAPVENRNTSHDKVEKRLVAQPNQSRYVKAELADVGTYMIAVGHCVSGKFDESAFRVAVEKLMFRHEALRTRFEISDQILAVVDHNPAYQFHLYAIENQNLAEFRQWALPLIFDGVDPRVPGSLVRFLVADMGSSWRFTIAAHHAITDGVSRNLMNKELLELYCGKSLSDARTYYDYQANVATNRVKQEIDSFVEAMPNPLRMANDGVGTSSGEFVERRFDEVVPKIKTLAKSLESSKFGVLTAIYALGLKGFYGENDISSFFQSAGRRSLDAPDDIVGPFSNTLPLDISVDPEKSFAAFARDLLTQIKSVLSLENGPLLESVIDAGKSPYVSINMFPQELPINVAELEIGPREFLDRRTEFDLNMVWSDELDALTARAFFSSAQVSKSRVQLFLDLQARLLVAVLENPHRSCRELIEEARVGFEAAEPAQGNDLASKNRLHSAFFKHANEFPNDIAIKTSSEDITYGALAKMALVYADAIKTAGLGAGDRVAILAQRHPTLVAATMGTSASGASFALIDAEYPAPRIEMMLNALGTRHMILAGADLTPQVSADVIYPSSDSKRSSENDVLTQPPRAEAYHLFTSGTTGQPKLISHSEETLQRFIFWQQQTLTSIDPICTIMMAGLAHDPTLRDVFLPLSFGGSIAIPTPCEMSEPKVLRTFIAEAGCNCVRFSPTTARLLTAGMRDDRKFPGLKSIFWGGERLPRETVKTWQRLAGQARQFNVFGSTETPQAFLIHAIESEKALTRNVPLGRPLPWNGARIVDDKGSIVSIGEIGEIVADLADPVGGSFRRFEDDPGPKDRVHYTGDLGYRMPDGNFFFVGRRDDQIKINGYRVELGEVESAVELIDGVERASAIVREDRLSVFTLSDDSSITEKTIRGTLAKRLPSYMVPAQIYILQELPYNSNGKIDRAKLREMALSPPKSADSENGNESPIGTSERSVARVFSRFSGRSGIDRRQSLSDFGADSLSMIEVRLELEGLGFELPEGWQWKSLAEIVAYNADSDPIKATGHWHLRRTETFVVLRCLAIISIVAFHSGFRFASGASIVLFVLAGYSFAHFHLPNILHDGHARRIWILIAKLLIPLVPISAIYFGINFYREVETQAASILFLSNFSNFFGFLFQYETRPQKGFEWIWFVHVYLQIFVIIGMLLSLPAVRRTMAADIWRGLAAFFILTESVSLLSIWGVSYLSTEGLDAGKLLHQTPVAIIPFLTIGGLVACAKTAERRVLTFAFTALHFAVVYQFYVDHTEIWWMLALLICAIFPVVSLPKIASKLVVTIAGYSLMIYLTHHAVFVVLYKFIGGEDASRLLSVIVQLCFGVLFGKFMRRVYNRLNLA